MDGVDGRAVGGGAGGLARCGYGIPSGSGGWIDRQTDRQAVVVWLVVSEVGLCLCLSLRHQVQHYHQRQRQATSTTISAISTSTRQRPLGQPWDCFRLGTALD